MKTILLSVLIGLALTQCPSFSYVSGGLQGSGFASRYWDCCKPSCSWTSNAGSGNECKQCDAYGNTIWDKNAQSICNGGPAATCLSQVPFRDSGCNTVAYAFGAVPGNGPSVCGRCFELSFTGFGKYETKENHKRLKGKRLIVMASNIGYDVAGGQFDIMIPGGGVGIFNGCSSMFGNNLGAQYGGLLTDCENQVGWGGSDDYIYKERKRCLAQKCNTIFSNSQARAGCNFLADFLEAAGNPLHSYREVKCPSQLSSKYK